MSNIKISIVVPNYNHGKYIPQCLNAILQQTHAPYEIIVVDDCSMDNSVAVIQEFMQRNPKIQLLINKQNSGVYPTIHRGLYAATGTHVLFAAADDWIEPTMLAEATAALEQYPQAGLWSSGSWIVYEEEPNKSIPALMYYPIKNAAYINPTQARELLCKLDSWFMGNSVIINREYLIAEQGFNVDLHSFADNFLYRVLVVKYGCCFNPEKLSTWRLCKNGHALSLNNNLSRQRKIIAKTKQMLTENYAGLFDAVTIKRFLNRLEFSLARSIWNNKSPDDRDELIKLMGYNNAIGSGLVILLQLIGKIPVIGNKAVVALLFLIIRPYDIWPQLKLRSKILAT